MKFRQAGFTLIELIVVVAIVAILASLAAPSFRTLMVKRAVLAAGETLVSDLAFARSEALKRTATTIVCRSTNGTSCAGIGSWSDGWIVFVNMDANTTVDAGDTVIRVQQAFSNIASIHDDSNPAGSTMPFIRYDPTGRARGANQTFNVTPTGTVPSGVVRVVCVSITGRPSLRAAGVITCLA